MSDDMLLRIIRNRYGSRWSIRRTGSLWLARAHDRDVSDVVHHDLDAFLGALECPHTRVKGASLLSAPYFADRAESRGDGAYRFADYS